MCTISCRTNIKHCTLNTVHCTLNTMSKGLDRVFLHYGVRKEDMAIIEQSCQDNDIDAEWVKENILKPYHEERNNQKVVEEKKLAKILKKALKNLPS